MNSNKLWTKDFILAFVANLLTAFAFYLLMPTLPFYLMEDLQLPKSQIGVYMSLYVVAVLATRPFSGYMTDKFPRKMFYLIMLVFFSLLFGGYMLSGSILLFAIIRIMHGIAWSMITTAGSTLALDILPSQRRGEGIGYYGLSMTLAMALGPMIGLFIHDNFSFNVIFTSALLSSIVACVVISFIKVRSKPVVDSSKISLDRFFLLKATPEVIALTLLTVSYGFSVSYVALFGKYINVENTGLFFVFMAAGTIITRFLSGRWIDSGRIITVIITSIFLLILVLVGFVFCESSLFYFALGFLSGLGFGAVSPAFQALILNLAPHNRRGTANSTYFIAFDLGIGIGILIGSKLIASISFSGMYAVGALFNILALIFFLSLVRPRHKMLNKN